MRTAKNLFWIFLIPLLLTFSAQAFALPSVCGPDPASQACITAVEAENSGQNGGDVMPNILSSLQGPVSPAQAGQTLAGTTGSFIKNTMAVGQHMANNFIPYAMELTALLGAIAFIWLGIMIMLSQADIWHMGLRPLFILIMTVGFTVWFLQSYDWLTTMVVTGFTFAGDIIIGAGSGAANASNSGSVLAAFGHTLFQSLDMMTEATAKAAFSSSNVFGDIIHFLENIPDTLLDDAVIMFSTAMFAILYILFVVVYTLYQVVIAIAVAVGPVFIPFLILPVTRSLFEGWLKMLLMSGIYLMTSTVIVGLVGGVMVTAIAGITASGPGNFGFNLLSVLDLAILELVSLLALFKTHEFAHAIGGSVSIGGMNAAGGIAKMGAKVATGGLG